MTETLTPEEQEFWDKYPSDQKKIENGVHILLVEYDPHMELKPQPLKTYLPGWKDKMRHVNEWKKRAGV